MLNVYPKFSKDIMLRILIHGDVLKTILKEGISVFPAGLYLATVNKDNELAVELIKFLSSRPSFCLT